MAERSFRRAEPMANGLDKKLEDIKDGINSIKVTLAELSEKFRTVNVEMTFIKERQDRTDSKVLNLDDRLDCVAKDIYLAAGALSVLLTILVNIVAHLLKGVG